jgi:hypothetical protein
MRVVRSDQQNRRRAGILASHILLTSCWCVQCRRVAFSEARSKSKHAEKTCPSRLNSVNAKRRRGPRAQSSRARGALHREKSQFTARRESSPRSAMRWQCQLNAVSKCLN